MSSTNWLELLKDAESSGTGNFAPIPDGVYELKVLDATAKATSNGKPMFELKAEVQVGPYAKRLVWDRLVVSKESSGAMGFFFRKMGALGLNTAFFQSEPDDATVAAALVGRQFRGELKTREYQGKQSNEITKYFPAVQGAPTGGAPAGYPAVPAPAAAPVPQAPVAAPAPAPIPQVPVAPQPQGDVWANYQQQATAGGMDYFAQQPQVAPAPVAPALPQAPAVPQPGTFAAPPMPPF